MNSDLSYVNKTNQSIDLNPLKDLGIHDVEKFYSYLTDRNFLLQAAQNKQSIQLLEKSTQGFFYYICLKENIHIPLNMFDSFNAHNYFYIYYIHKNNLSLSQLLSISEITQQTLVNQPLQDSPYISSIISSIPYISAINNFSDLEELIYEKSYKEYNRILTENNNKLSFNVILAYEDFFLTNYLYHPQIKDDLKYCASTEPIDFSTLYISDSLFDLLAYSLGKNPSCVNNYLFNERYFEFLNIQLNSLIHKGNYDETELNGEGDYFISLLENFTFNDSDQHFNFLTMLAKLLEKESPEHFIKIFQIINLDVSNREDYIFKICFPLLCNRVNIEKNFFPQDLMERNKDFIRDIIISKSKNLHTSSIKSIYSQYYELFNFSSNGENFNSVIFNEDFNEFLLNLSENDIFSIFSFPLDAKRLDVNDEKDCFFAEKYIQLFLCLHDKTKDYFEDFFNNQKEIANMLTGFYYHFSFSSEDDLHYKINNFYNSFGSSLSISKQRLLKIFIQLNHFSHTLNVLNEHAFSSSLKLNKLDIDQNYADFKLDIPSLDYLNSESYIEGNSIGVFSNFYYQKHYSRIQENLVTYFLYSLREEIIKHYEVKPSSKLLSNMVPPIVNKKPSNHKNHKNPLFSSNSSITLTFNEIIEYLFHDKTLLKNSRIQRFLFVFFFNNTSFDFFKQEYKDLIRKEINLFLFKHYSFDHGYNFSQENVRLDFNSEYSNIIQERNKYIQIVYILSSQKFAARVLLNEVHVLDLIYIFFPHDNLNFLNYHIIPLLKSFYLNLSAIVDFKITKQQAPFYNQLFKNISKVLLQELLETNFKRFKKSDLDMTDILNYLFSNHQTLNIQKFKIYPEIQFYLKDAGYKFLLTSEESSPLAKTFGKKINEGFKRFFVLSLFMSDDSIVSDVIKTLYNNRELYSLYNLFENNNILFSLSPKVFTTNVLKNTFNKDDIQNYFDMVTENIFIEQESLIENISTDDIYNFLNLTKETHYLYSYGFLEEKIELPETISNNLFQFLDMLLNFLPSNENSLVEIIQYLTIFNINQDILKYFLIEKQPALFLLLDKRSNIYIDLNKVFKVTKQDMLVIIKNLFKTPTPDIAEAFFGNKNLFNDWLDFYCKDIDSLKVEQNKKETFIYLWNNCDDCPELRVFLLNFSLILGVFSSDIFNILPKSLDLIQKDPIYINSNHLDFYHIETDLNSNINYHLFYYYILHQLNFDHNDLLHLLRILDQKYVNITSNQATYIRVSYYIYNIICSNLSISRIENQKNRSKFLAPIEFRNVLIQYYSIEKDFSHFIFMRQQHIDLLHEDKNLRANSIANQDLIRIEPTILNMQKNIGHDNILFMLALPSNNPTFTTEFFTFLLNLLHKDGGSTQKKIILEFILFNLALVNSLSIFYNSQIYQELSTNIICLDYIKEYRELTLLQRIDVLEHKRISTNRKKI